MKLSYSLEKEFTLTGRVNAHAFSPCGRHLAVALKDGVSVWDTTTWALHLCFRRDSVPVLSLSWDARSRLFFGCEGGFLNMVSFEEKEYHVQGFRASEKGIRFIGISADTRYLALGGSDEVTIWQMAGKKPRPKWVFKSKLGDPQDQYDKTMVNVMGIAWVNGSSTNLVVSYEKQGVVTWNLETASPLYRSGQVDQESWFSARANALRVVIDGGPFFAVSSEKKILVRDRQNGKDHRCLPTPTPIPHQSPIIWAHEGTCIIAAVEGEIILLHIEKRLQRTVIMEGCRHVAQNVTHIAWNKSSGDNKESYRMALVTNGHKLHIVRADGVHLLLRLLFLKGLKLNPTAPSDPASRSRRDHFLKFILVLAILVGLTIYMYISI